ncbi:MAG: hypothetical protein ACRDTO_12975, partial [Mycobacterium sp.]
GPGRGGRGIPRVGSWGPPRWGIWRVGDSDGAAEGWGRGGTPGLRGSAGLDGRAPCDGSSPEGPRGFVTSAIVPY